MKNILVEPIKNTYKTDILYLVREDDGVITKMDWEEWKMLSDTNDSSEVVKSKFLIALLNTIYSDEFLGDFNKFVFSKERSFTQIVDWLIGKGAKYDKDGITT